MNPLWISRSNASPILLLDISLNKAIDILQWIKINHPSVKVIVVTNVSDSTVVWSCMKARADGYFLIRKTGFDRLPDFISDACEGGYTIDFCHHQRFI